MEHFINEAYVSNPLDSKNPSLGLSNAQIIVKKYNYTCVFTRENSMNISNYVNLNPGEKFYIIAAFGTIYISGPLNFIQHHGSNRFISSELTFPNSITTQATTKITSTTTTNQEQGKRVVGNYSTEGYLIKWIDEPEWTDFEFSAKNYYEFSNFWAAFAFSKDNLMESLKN